MSRKSPRKKIVTDCNRRGIRNGSLPNTGSADIEMLHAGGYLMTIDNDQLVVRIMNTQPFRKKAIAVVSGLRCVDASGDDRIIP